MHDDLYLTGAHLQHIPYVNIHMGLTFAPCDG